MVHTMHQPSTMLSTLQDPHNKPAREELLSLFLIEMRKLRQTDQMTCPRSQSKCLVLDLIPGLLDSRILSLEPWSSQKNTLS